MARNFIWLDDIRNPPGFEFMWAKTVQEAISFLDSLEGMGPIYISFDHDLGENEQTGYDLAKYIEAKASNGHFYPIVAWRVHSANPVGKANIQAAMRSFEKISAKALDNLA